jgi:hypothetical protein
MWSKIGLEDLTVFWIDTDKALPAMNSQIVKFKVNLAGKYITKGHYDHNKQCWCTESGHYISADDVYAWKCNESVVSKIVDVFLPRLDI